MLITEDNNHRRQKMDSQAMKISRRKTLDVSRLPSASLRTPIKEKRYSFDHSQSPLRSSNTSEKLAFIEESLKVLKAEANPLYQTPRQGFRSLTASSVGSKSTKWVHKEDTAELRTCTSKDKSMPPRYQKRHKGQFGTQYSPEKERKSRQTGWSTIFFTVLALVAVFGVNYFFIKDFQKGMCARNLTLNMTSFNATLREQVFGQHLAVDIIPSLVYEHTVPFETKPLVMAFLVRLKFCWTFADQTNFITHFLILWETLNKVSW